MSTDNPSGKSSRRPSLIKESPFARLAQRTQDVGEEALKEARLLDINRIRPNPNQPRRYFSEKALQELAADIKARGILQPPIVRHTGANYEIVVGERRYRAALEAGLTHIPVLIQDLTDEEARIASLVENIQREDLSFEDEARYFEILSQDYSYSIRQIAQLVNKSKSYVDARLTLLKHPQIMAAVQSEKIGLHEATLLARMGITYDEQDERLERGVREKDSPASDDTVREKDNFNQFKLAQPFRRLTDLIKNTRRKIERASTDEKAAILRAVEDLEVELEELRRRLDGV